jgi:hypothetical protein
MEDLKKGTEEVPTTQPQSESVIDMIQRDRKTEVKIDASVLGIAEIITAETFFMDNNPGGAMKIATFKRLINELQISQLREMEMFIDRLSEGVHINFKSLAYGKDGIKKFYANVPGVRGKQEFTLPAVDNIFVFLQFYIDGLFACKLSFKELYEYVKAH